MNKIGFTFLNFMKYVKQNSLDTADVCRQISFLYATLELHYKSETIQCYIVFFASDMVMIMQP